MPLPLLITSRFAFYTAAATGCGWTAFRWFQRRNSNTLLERDDIAHSIDLFALGSSAGLLFSLPYLVFGPEEIAFVKALESTLVLGAVYAPLYVPVALRYTRYVSRYLPHSIVALSSSTAVVYYGVQIASQGVPSYAALIARNALMGTYIGTASFFLFILCNRYHLAIRFLVQELIAQGHTVFCGDLAPALGLVFGNFGAFLVLNQSLIYLGTPVILYVDFVSCAIGTFFSFSSQPDMLTMRLRTQTEAERQVYWWLGIMGGTIVAAIIFPSSSPIPWVVASLTGLLNTIEWNSIDAFIRYGPPPSPAFPAYSTLPSLPTTFPMFGMGSGGGSGGDSQTPKNFEGKGQKVGTSTATTSPTTTTSSTSTSSSSSSSSTSSSSSSTSSSSSSFFSRSDTSSAATTGAAASAARDAELRAAAAEKRRAAARSQMATSTTATTTTNTSTTPMPSSVASSSSSSSSTATSRAAATTATTTTTTTVVTSATTTTTATTTTATSTSTSTSTTLTEDID